MFLEYTPEQQALRKELREYFAQLLTPDVRAELGEPGEGSPLFRDVVRQIGTDGWLGIGWPQEYGGQGRPATDQFIFFDEVQRAGAPFPFVTLNTVGPTIMRFGSDEQKSFFLPGILAGEINFAIGYTEPEAGTDLASLRTRAVLDGDEWVINGNKVFTSGANQCRRRRRGSSARRSSPSAGTRQPRRTTTTCALRKATSSAMSTPGGS
jgi:alkylation response protein AidB-like acyl-CoA dehydrogenase